MSGYAHVIRWRYAFVGLQCLALVGFVGVFWLRSAPAAKAVRSLDAGHVLRPGDLVLQASEPLIGQALRDPVRTGDPIRPEHVRPAPAAIAATTSSGSVAALITMAEDQVTRYGLTAGVKVLVRRHALPDLPGSVTSISCQQKVCVLAVALEALPKEEVTLQSFSTAELLPHQRATSSPLKPH